MTRLEAATLIRNATSGHITDPNQLANALDALGLLEPLELPVVAPQFAKTKSEKA